MIKYTALLISLLLIAFEASAHQNTKKLKPGATFELECPMIALKQLTSLRTYALILNNAQKNMQIKIYTKKKNKSYPSKNNEDTLNSTSVLIFGKKQSQQQEQPQCILNKNNKICVLDGFVKEFNAKCSSSGSVSMLIVEPAFIASSQTEEIKQRTISPVLDIGEKVVVIFRPDDSLQLQQIDKSQIFISNCIESIEYFRHQFLLGVIGKQFIQVIMTSEQITGVWSFASKNDQMNRYEHPIQTYSMQYRSQIFQLKKQQAITKEKLINYYYGFKLLICSQNQSLIQNLSINITVMLKMQSILVDEEQANYSITIKQGQLFGQMPVKLAFYYYDHSILSIKLRFSLDTHYILQLSETRAVTSLSLFEPPIIEEDEYLFFCFEKNKIDKVLIQAHIQKSYRQKLTPTLKIISYGVQAISAKLSNGHISDQGSNQINNSSEVEEGDKQIKIQNGKMLPVYVSTQAPYAQIMLQVETSKFNKSKQLKSIKTNRFEQMIFFRLKLETSYVPIQIQVGKEIVQYLFLNEIKRFIVPKEQMQSLKSKKLKVVCTECHAFLTYNPDCSNINCCEYAHANQVDVKASNLLIVVVASTHTQETSIIKLQLIEDQKAFVLIAGKIVQGLLMNSDTYIYESDGKSDLQIIYNSQVQSILMLVTVSQNSFPNKTSFDYQSNEGYIKIPSIKIKKTIYIRLLKMVSTYQGNFKVPYSLVILSEGSKLQLIQGRQLSHLLIKNSNKQYVMKHPCNTQESLYLRVHPKSYSSILGINSLDVVTPSLEVQIILDPDQKPVYTKQIIKEDTIDVTRSLKIRGNYKPYGKKNLQICQIVVRIKNLLQETLQLSLMFFKQRQVYQVHAGHFIQDHTLAGNRIMLYCVIDPQKDTNIYSYSLREQITMKTTLISVNELRMIQSSNQLNNNSYNRTYNKKQSQKKPSGYKTLYRSSLSQSSHSQFQHISSQQQLNNNRNSTNLTVFIIQIFKDGQQKGFQSDDIFVICTQNQTTMRVGNRIQYKIQDKNSHTFSYPLSAQLFLSRQKNRDKISKNIANNDKQIILQNIKLDGSYFIQAKLKYFGQNITPKGLSEGKSAIVSKQKTIRKKNDDPIFTIKIQNLKIKLNEYFKDNIEKQSSKSETQKNEMRQPVNLEQVQFENLFLQFEVTCSKSNNKYCIFITSLQTSQSDIRQLTPGVPQAFLINKHSSIIFIYDNVDDQQFKFKVNRKIGFPNYKLCSFRKDLLASKSQNALDTFDKCLAQLKNPQNQLNLRIQQNAFNEDANLIVGRTHELIINQYNQQYCTNCAYYLGLYSDYNVVEGSIFVMNSNQGTYLQEGSSITTIVYRGEPDKYVLINWQSLMGIVYQLQGNVQVEIFYFDSENNTKISVLKKQSLNYTSGKQKSHNVIAINLVNQSSLQKPSEYQLEVKPANNMPSALYTLVIMNKQQQIINIKDGVPYQMEYTIQSQKEKTVMNPIIKYRYLCQNQGVIMVTTKDFNDLDIIVGCRDSIINQETGKLSQQTENLINIQDLLKAKAKYAMSNRLDINISPKICNHYQLTVATKSPSVSYSILVSSTDIISLPLNKQVPGILKHQTKLYQIYEVSVNEKTQVRCTFKFCQGGQGRIMIAKSKKNVFSQIYEEEIQIYEATTFETLKYIAKPGLFYIKLEFKSRGGVMQYTIHAESTNRDSISKLRSSQSISPIKIYKNLNQITYKVKKVGYNSTRYEIQFYRIIQDIQIFQIEYFIVESANLNSLKKTENCNGQYFVEILNHHEQIKQTRIKINPKKQQIQPEISNTTSIKQPQDSDMKITFQYQTTTPYAYVTIIPIVYNSQSHQFYHLYIPKYHQVQLTNGQIFARLSYILGEIASRVEQFVDIHGSQDAILIILAVLFSGCLIATLLGGVWIGSRYFFKTKTVYVLKELRQQQNEEENDHEDNRVQDDPVNNTSASTQVLTDQIRLEDSHIQIQSAQEIKKELQKQMKQDQEAQPENHQNKKFQQTEQNPL